MKGIYAIFLLGLLVLASGCIQPSEERPVRTSASDGIVINEFSSDLTRYESTETIPLYLEIENVGGTTASDVTARILGASWVGSVPTKNFGTLSPPDLTVTPPVPGDFKTWAITLNPFTDVPQGVETPITLIARVEYDYSSNGAVHIDVLSKDEYKRRIQRGESIPTAPAVENSAGPIHIDIGAPRQPPVLDTRDNVTVLILFNNVGSGVPITKEGAEGNITVDLTVTGLNAKFVKCLDTEYTPPKTSVTIQTKLRRGESAKIPCMIEVDKPTAHNTFTVLFKTNYRYYIEQPLTITIVGS